MLVRYSKLALSVKQTSKFCSNQYQLTSPEMVVVLLNAFLMKLMKYLKFWEAMSCCTNHIENSISKGRYWNLKIRKCRTTILITASIVRIGNRPKIGDCFMMSCCTYAVLTENMSITFISTKSETAMTTQGHMTTVSLKQANKDYIEGRFLSTCFSKSSAHPSLQLHTINWGTLNSMM